MSTVEWVKDQAASMYVVMVDATDNETEETALVAGDLSVSISKNGGVLSSVSPTITAITESAVKTGAFIITFAASATDTAGPLLIRVTAGAVANTWWETREVVDRSTANNKVYLDDTTIERLASAVLCTQRATAISDASGASWDLNAAPDDEHREALVGAIAGITGGWAIAGNDVTVKDSAGNSVYVRLMAGTVAADSASLATGVS